MQISYNKLKTFGECALKYRLAYVERLPRPPIASLAFQRRLHAALARYHHFARRDGIVNEQELLDAYAELHDVKSNPDVRQSPPFQEGEAILRQYCELENQKQRVPAFLEHTVRVAFGPYNLTGKIDRIDFADDNRYRILDYKLDRRVPVANQAETSRQLGFYQLLVQEGLGLPVEDVRLLYLRHGVEHVRPCSVGQLRETVDWVDETADAIHREKTWQPRPGQGCATCAFHSHCPAKTGHERVHRGVWQQGNLLMGLDEEPEPPSEPAPEPRPSVIVRQTTLEF